jgi:hypothetical protein
MDQPQPNLNPVSQPRIKPRTVIALGIFTVLVIMGLAIAFVPRLMAETASSTPTVEPTAKATSTLRPMPTVAPPSPTPLLETVVVPTPTPTSMATPTPSNPSLCAPGTQILAPLDGAKFRVGDTIVVSGTAATADFLYYKIEYQTILTQEPDLWAEAFTSPRQPLTQPTPIPDPGILASWNTSAVERGTYRVRLLVIDRTGNYRNPCVITVSLSP